MTASLFSDAPGWSVFSECGKYRYVLGRRWANPEIGSRFVAFIGINPSTADGTKDDQTVRRCTSFAKSWGFDGFIIVNIFAIRSRDPKAIRAASDPRGPLNDAFLSSALSSQLVKYVVAAWGDNCTLQAQSWIANLCRLHGRALSCLGITSKGKPRHPLMVQRGTPLVSWSENDGD